MIKYARSALLSALLVGGVVGVGAPAAVGSSTPAAASTTASAATSPDLSNPYSVYTKLLHTYSFPKTSLESDLWSTYNDGNTWKPGLVSVSSTFAHLKTTGESGSGVCICRVTKPKAPYGRWDVRARASADPYHGFAIELWPNSGGVAQGGEIDMAEFSGARDRLFTTLHYGTNSRYILRTAGNFTTWHTYSVAWSPDELDYAVDGKIIMRIHDKTAIPDDPMHLALQAQPYHPTGAPNTSATLDVAYVKQYVAAS